MMTEYERLELDLAKRDIRTLFWVVVIIQIEILVIMTI